MSTAAPTAAEKRAAAEAAKKADADARFAQIVAGMNERTPHAPPALSARCRFAVAASAAGLVWAEDPASQGAGTRAEAVGLLPPGCPFDPDSAADWDRATEAAVRLKADLAGIGRPGQGDIK